MSSPINLLAQANRQLPEYTVTAKIHEGIRTTVYRATATATQQPVVIKVLSQPYPSFGQLAQFRNQYTIAKNLPIAGIVRPLSLLPWGNGYALVMEDFGGDDLAHYVQQFPPSLAEVLEIGIQLATILQDLHQHRVIHKDIKPANILIHPVTQQVKLTDFSIASLLPKETQAIQSPLLLEGTLAYLAPEQTGRMNRAIDYRSDFYGLGVTLYELLTGQLPFQSDDPLELTHCHLAKQASAPTELNPGIPTMVSAIVLKLMAKNAEDRYYSALGLKYDLEHCLHQFQQTGTVDPFELGSRDLSDRFLIPEKLYGREAEVMALLAAFNRVSAGSSELLLVAGYSGVGKTAVINEVHKPITRQHGYFIKGKFDQFNRNIPFSAFVQAFRSLMGQLLGESDTALTDWKAKILKAVGENGQVLIDVIPELQCIIGEQPAVPELSGTAAQNRFNLLLSKFIRVFTTADHPLVIFLDDLQWVDSASLNLFKLLMADDSGHLLVLGAYRDNEVFPAHPLMLMLDDLRQQQRTIRTLTLEPLRARDINRLVADSLHCSGDIAQPLAQLVYQKTEGNPFFATQFLQGLHSDGWITFNTKVGYWQCDLTQVRQLALTDDVVEFMVGRIQKLPEMTQTILKIAACIGNQFDLATLAVVCEQSQKAVAANLWQSLQVGLVIPENETYKFFQDTAEATNPEQNAQSVTVGYRFLHDRVQQAAYRSIPVEQTTTIHLQIGRLLLKQASEQALDSHLFEIVNQLNCGIELIHCPQEQVELAVLNLKAGKKARLSTAYDAAMNYLNTGLTLIPPNGWVKQYSLTLSLHHLASEVAYLASDYNLMNTILEIGLKKAKDNLDRVPFYETQILALVAQNQAKDAVKYARQVLSKFGVRLPKNPSSWQKTLGFLSTLYRMAGKKPEDFLNLPQMTDPYKLAACRLINATGSAAGRSMPEMLPFITFTGLALYLRYGNIPKSPMGYVIYAFLICEKLGQINKGCAIGRAAISLCYQSSRTALAPTLFLWNRFLAYRQESLHTTAPLLLEAYQVGLETGDIEYASYSLSVYFTQAYWMGKNLDDLLKDAIASRSALQQLQQQAMLDIFDLNCQVVENLLLKQADIWQIAGQFFDEANISNQDLQLWVQHSFRKLQLAYLFGHYALAAEQIEQIEQNLHILEGTFINTMFYFYRALVKLAEYPHLSKDQQKLSLKQVDKTRQKLRYWAKFAPMNYEHKLFLVEAERFRVLDQTSQASEYYDRAIAGAKVNEYIQEESLANELAAKFYLNWGKEKVAAGYMQDAYYGYAKWGAKAKTDDLEQRYPELLRPVLQSSSGNFLEILNSIAAPTISVHSSSNTFASNNDLNQTLDFASILKSSQALASIIHRDELLQQLGQIILQNSGGDRCVLVLPNHAREWQVAVIATLDGVTLCNLPLEDADNLPLKLIQYVKNTQEGLVIDSVDPNLPILDPFLEEEKPRSVLCLPLLHQRQLMAILYVSNQATEGIFTQDRILILNFLCTPAAIALENAQLFEARQQSEAEQRRQLAILESTSDFIGSADPNGAILYLNQAWRKLLQTAEGKPVSRVIISEQHPVWALEIIANEALPTAIQQGMWVGETALLDGNGREVPVSQVVIAHKSDQGNVEYFSTIARDISELKQAEKSLKLTQFAVQKTAVGIFWIREDGLLLNVNEAACNSLGYSPEELQGLYVWEIDAYMQAHEWPQYWASLKQNISVRFETYHQSKDGKIFPVEITSNYLEYDGQGFSFSQAQDISDRKAYEENLQQTNAELIRATRLKDEFLATMSHELRTPLNAVLGMAESLQEEIFGPINSRQLEALNLIEQSGTHLLLLINDILDLSKITAEKLKLDLEPTDVIQLCQDALLLIQQQAQRKGLQLQTTLPATLPLLLMDEKRVKQLLINLLSNAVKFTPEGGQIELIVDGQPSLDATGSCPSGFLRIIIRDTGIGIAPQDINRIFQPFVQVDSALNRKYEGTGLGLTLVKQIAELHGGKVFVTSKVSVGSTFTIELPWLRDTAPPKSRSTATGEDKIIEEQPAQPSSNAPFILLVEDDAANILTISSYLEAQGYCLALAENGLEALEILQSVRPTVILMDMQMPVMDGLEATKRIRQDLGLVDIPIIALTALAMKEDQARCLTAGANQYLSKPVKLKTLHALLQQYL